MVSEFDSTYKDLSTGEIGRPAWVYSICSPQSQVICIRFKNRMEEIFIEDTVHIWYIDQEVCGE